MKIGKGLGWRIEGLAMQEYKINVRIPVPVSSFTV